MKYFCHECKQHFKTVEKKKRFKNMKCPMCGWDNTGRSKLRIFVYKLVIWLIASVICAGIGGIVATIYFTSQWLWLGLLVGSLLPTIYLVLEELH